MPTEATSRISCTPLRHGELGDHSHSALPTTVTGWLESPLELGDRQATHFGFVIAGATRLECAAGAFNVNSGMYFAAPGKVRLTGGRGLIASRLEYRGFFHLGGPIEERGRLRYIDGCSDSLLIAPVSLGDACLNLLYVPQNTNQSAHTHPSLRVGVIVRGAGVCRTPQGDLPLAPGVVFQLPADERHSFHTADSALTIVAYHPDSDFGPTDQDHPMLNRTILSRD